MTLSSTLSSTKTKITLWILLTLGVVGLGVVLIFLFGGNKSTSFTLQEPAGTCYRFDPNVARPPLPGLTYSECQQQPHWYSFCFSRQHQGDPGCFLRAVEENQGRQGPDYDKLADGTKGNCQINSPEDLVIRDISYAECRANPNWLFFAYGRKSIAFRYGRTNIRYKKGQAVLEDTNINCINKPDGPFDTRGYICTNSRQWCSYDNPSFCVKK